MGTATVASRGTSGLGDVDVVVVGGGIVGMATALSLSEVRPGIGIAVLEKESALARHQTGRNSGVIHSGIYYRPGSAKAVLCRAGVGRLLEFCSDESIPVARFGKVIVATGPAELPALEDILARGVANGVPGVRRIGGEELRDLEPSAKGLAALHSPTTSSVDYREVTEAMARRVRAAGGSIELGAEVSAIRRIPGRIVVEAGTGEVHARVVVNCAGLQADRVAALDGVRPDLRIVPFRGEFFTLRPDREHLVRGLIYPVPDPSFPFLGVHLTRGVHGGVHAGPNAVLALAREGYTWRNVDARDLWEALTWRGTLRLGRRFWRTGLGEAARSLDRTRFARSVARLVPDVGPGDLVPAPAGVRAQAVGRDGRLLDDFFIARSDRAVHVLNVPSPAATASLAIGAHVVRAVLAALDE
jgi:L-2-hydroxyglutarate oxidase